MPSSTDRKRLEVPTYLHDRLVEIAVDEQRTVASVTQEILSLGLEHYIPDISADSSDAFYTPRARRAFDHAREEGRALNHNYLGTEHFLLGLLRVREGVAARVLADLDVDFERVHAWVDAHIGRGKGTVSGVAPVVPRARNALRLAREAADRQKSVYIGTEHLLLGLAQVPDGVAARILDGMGVLGRVQPELLRALRDEGGIETTRIAGETTRTDD